MNQLKVNQQEAISAPRERGWSKRKIARELGLDRVTVRRYLAVAAAKSPTPQTGSPDPKSPTPQTGSSGSMEAKSPGAQTGSSDSLCAPWEAQIEPALKAGLSMQRIYQDLVDEHRFNGSYHSVRRFVLRRQPAGAELPYRRLECEPGAELQVDFGQGAWIEEKGKRRKTHLFRCVLGCSRKGYTEAVW